MSISNPIDAITVTARGISGVTPQVNQPDRRTWASDEGARVVMTRDGITFSNEASGSAIINFLLSKQGWNFSIRVGNNTIMDLSILNLLRDTIMTALQNFLASIVPRRDYLAEAA